MPKRFGPGEREALNKTIDAAMETQKRMQPQMNYSRGYADGFEDGILAKERSLEGLGSASTKF